MLDPNAQIPLNYKPTPEDLAWRLYRTGWWGFQLLLFLTIAWRIGPNLLLFHSPFSPGPEDYVPYTKQYAPIIAAIKAYDRDFGKLPDDSWGLPPQYMPPGFKGEGGEILPATSLTIPIGAQGVLEYEFSPEKEGWWVHSPRYDGPIPAPIVPAAPKLATQPSTTSPTNASHGN
jgi:hypothetical protein